MFLSPDQFAQVLLWSCLFASVVALLAALLLPPVIERTFDLYDWLIARWFPDRCLRRRIWLLSLRSRYRALRATKGTRHPGS